MNLISKISNTFKNLYQKGVRFYPLNRLQILGNGDYDFGSNAYENIKEAYGKNPYVFMVVDRIVQRSLDVEFMITDKDGEEIKSLDPRFKIIIERPNAEGFKQTLYRLLTNSLISDAFVIEQQTIGIDKMTRFIVPNSFNVTINTDSHGQVNNYTYTWMGETHTVEPDKVLHIKRPDVTTELPEGRSTLEAMRKVWKSNNEVWNSEAALHKNKGINGIVSTKGTRPMETTERDELQKEYDSVSTGSNFGKVRVAKTEVTYTRMGVNPSDLQSLETKVEHLRTTCANYNADPRLFGDPQGSTYNNMRESKLGLITDAVIPLLNRVMSELFLWLSGKLNVEYFYKVIEDSIAEMQLVKELMSARVGREVIQGIISANQARQILYPHLITEGEEVQPGNANTTDLLAILAAVQEESLPRESAIIIMMQNFGFTEETANQILP